MGQTGLRGRFIQFVVRFARFGTVGGIGFIVDSGFLLLFNSLMGFNPYGSRLVSIVIAMGVTWRLNRSVTFQPSGQGQLQEGARYGGVAVVTAVVNYLIYAALLMLVAGMPPLLATVLSTAITMFMSYFGYSRLVFGR